MSIAAHSEVDQQADPAETLQLMRILAILRAIDMQAGPGVPEIALAEARASLNELDSNGLPRTCEIDHSRRMFWAPRWCDDVRHLANASTAACESAALAVLAPSRLRVILESLEAYCIEHGIRRRAAG